MKRIVYIFSFLLCISCSKDSTEITNTSNNFNIYLVEEGQLELHNSEADLDGLKLESKPWVKSSDIDFYDWSAQAFYLKKVVEKISHSASHFMVTSGKRRLFLGVFWPSYMSSFPMIPSILPEDDWWSPKDIIRFNSFGWLRNDILSKNDEFKTELINSGILREGIKVEIIELKRKDNSTLQYSYKLSNLETQPVYVLDSDKMGAARFHYHTNGPNLQLDDKYYSASNFETIATKEIDASWYKKLSSGQSITRSVELSGYTSIPLGKVKATFMFPGSPLTKSKSWQKSDGRIWVGGYIAEKELTVH